MLDFSTESILALLYALPGVLFALSVHEFSHAYVASKLGDPTAKFGGRLTLNPLKHIDIFGFICLLVVGFGWAKPVQINTRYFKNAKRDTALTALAGPLSNIISAFIATFLYWLFVKLVFNNYDLLPISVVQGLLYIFQNFIFINVGLAVFNFIPIPPLDGSRILDAFLPTKAYIAYHKYEQIISIVLFALIVFDVFNLPINTAIQWIVSGMTRVAEIFIKI